MPFPMFSQGTYGSGQFHMLKLLADTNFKYV